MKFMRAISVLAVAAFIAAPAFAETQNVKVSGSLDAYAIYRNNYDLFDGNDAGTVINGATVPGSSHSGSTSQRSDSDSFFMSITQVQIAADLTNNVSTVINLINQRDWNANPLDAAGVQSATNGANNEFDVLLDLAYVQMKEIFYSPLTLTIGRQDLLFGRGFIIGWNPQDSQNLLQADEFTQVQSFDAIRATLDFNPWTIDFVYSKIDENSDNSEDDSDLYITNINYKFAEYNAVAEGYYVEQNVGSTALTTESSNTSTLGGRVQFDPISQITLGAELAFQFGKTAATPGTPDRDRDAWATDLFGEYRWDNTWKPMLGIQYVYLGGEENLSTSTNADNGAWNGAFRGPIYGWIHDYREVYFATAAGNDQAAGQNQQHISIYGTIKPLDDLQLGVNYFHFWTAEDSHTVTTDPTTSLLNDTLGDEIDTLITYNYTEDVTFNFMVDWFIPGDYFQSPFDDAATQVVSEVKVTF